MLKEGIYWNKKYSNKVKLHEAINGDFFYTFFRGKDVVMSTFVDEDDLEEYTGQDTQEIPSQ